ncbi:MAG: hypothetical protein JNM27_09215 [Leptospirales bacterium]|nr:hypothetical protein [Leptospirales bacterium]
MQFIRAVTSVAALLLVGLNSNCLTFVTYYSIPRGTQIYERVTLGTPHSYQIDQLKYKLKQGKYMTIYLDGDNTWSHLQWLALSTNDSAGPDSPIESNDLKEVKPGTPLRFAAPVHIQTGVHFLSSDGLLGDFSNVRWHCKDFATKAREGLLSFNADMANAGDSADSVALQERDGRLFVRVSGHQPRIFETTCPGEPPGSWAVNLRATTADSVRDLNEGDWRMVPSRKFAREDHLIIFTKPGTGYVLHLPDLASYNGPRIVVVDSLVRRDVRFYDKKIALLLPFALAVDIVTAPISIPLLYWAHVLWRGHFH